MPSDSELNAQAWDALTPPQREAIARGNGMAVDQDVIDALTPSGRVRKVGFVDPNWQLESSCVDYVRARIAREATE